MKLRTGEPWIPAPQYGRSLTGVGVNLLVRAIAPSVAFQRAVLGAEIVYEDPDFAVIRLAGAEVMLHADHTYDKHPMRRDDPRGNGVELRVHHTDPDKAAQAAAAAGHTVLSPPVTKGHGLREAYIVDPDGYIWVPDVPAT